MTKQEIAGVLLSYFYRIGIMSVREVAASLGESYSKVDSAYTDIIMPLQLRVPDDWSTLRTFYEIEQVKVLRLPWK